MHSILLFQGGLHTFRIRAFFLERFFLPGFTFSFAGSTLSSIPVSEVSGRMGSRSLSFREERRVKDVIVIVVGLGLVWWTVELVKNTFGLRAGPKLPPKLPPPKGSED